MCARPAPGGEGANGRGCEIPLPTLCVCACGGGGGVRGSWGPPATEGKGQQLSPEGPWWRGWRTEAGGFGTPAVPAGLPCSPPPNGPGTNSAPLPPWALQRAPRGCRKPSAPLLLPGMRSQSPVFLPSAQLAPVPSGALLTPGLPRGRESCAFLVLTELRELNSIALALRAPIWQLKP